MDWNSNEEQSRRNIGILRQSHVNLHISAVHLVTFKQHLIQTLREFKIKEKEVVEWEC